MILLSDHEIFPVGSSESLIQSDRNHHGGGIAFVVSDQPHICVRPDLREGKVESL